MAEPLYGLGSLRLLTSVNICLSTTWILLDLARTRRESVVRTLYLAVLASWVIVGVAAASKNNLEGMLISSIFFVVVLFYPRIQKERWRRWMGTEQGNTTSVAETEATHPPPENVPRTTSITAVSAIAIVYGLLGFAFGLPVFLAGLLSSISVEPLEAGNGSNVPSLVATHNNTVLGAFVLTVAVIGIVSGTKLLSSRKGGGRLALLPLAGGLGVLLYLAYLGGNPLITLISSLLVLVNVVAIFLLAFGWKSLR